MTAPDPRLRARRMALCALVWSLFGVLGGIYSLFELFKPRYQMRGWKNVPEPTAIVWRLGERMRTLPGVAVSVLLAVLATSLILRRACDQHLSACTFTLIAATLVFGAYVVVALCLPFILQP